MVNTPRGSEAYDLSLFESRQSNIVALKPNKKQQKEQTRRARLQSVLNMAVAVFVAAAVIAVVGLMIASRVRLTEMNTEINNLQEELAALQSETITLKNELASQTSAESVEAYVEAHGMQKTESYQMRYISVESGDRIERPEETDTPWYAAVADWFASLF